MKIKVKLDEGAIMPLRAHKTDAGYDLFAREDFVVYRSTEKNKRVNVGYAIHDTGVHIEIPSGYVGFLKSKSGLNVKRGLTSEGVIDSGYTGSIVVKLYNHTAHAYKVRKGDKITQLVLLPIFTPELTEVDYLGETDRGDGGFGSTGR